MSSSARPIASAVISFGLVSIPVKVYVAASSQGASFNLLHKKCGSRLRQQYHCPVCTDGSIEKHFVQGNVATPRNALVERDEMVKGFEFAKDQYVEFSEDELKKLEFGKTDSLEITEFVPADSIDPVQIEKNYYLGPDKGADKAYQLLARAMGGGTGLAGRSKKKAVVGVGKYWTRGRLQLVFLRPYHETGLLMQYAFYGSETRPFEEAGAALTFTSLEEDLASRLVERLTSSVFKPDKYREEYQDRVRAAVDQKVAGREVTVAEEAPQPVILDLFEALKRSLM
jgi:DNA end-binding protein Ku